MWPIHNTHMPARRCACAQTTQHNCYQDRESPALMVSKGWLTEGRHLERGKEFQAEGPVQQRQEGRASESISHTGVSHGSTGTEAGSTQKSSMRKARGVGCRWYGAPEMPGYGVWILTSPTNTLTTLRDWMFIKLHTIADLYPKTPCFSVTKGKMAERKFSPQGNLNKFICRRKTSEHQVQSDPQWSNNHHNSFWKHSYTAGRRKSTWSISWTFIRIHKAI